MTASTVCKGRWLYVWVDISKHIQKKRGCKPSADPAPAQNLAGEWSFSVKHLDFSWWAHSGDKPWLSKVSLFRWFQAWWRKENAQKESMSCLWIYYSFPKQAHLYIPAPRCVDVHPSQLVRLENLAQPILGSSMPTDSNEVWDWGACVCVCGTFLVISKTGSAVPLHFLSALGTSTDSHVSKCLKPSASRDQWKDRLALFPKTIGFCVAAIYSSSCASAAAAAAWWVKEDVMFYFKLPGDPGTKICASEKSAPWWHFKVLRQGLWL